MSMKVHLTQAYPWVSLGVPGCPWIQAEGRLGCMVGVGLLLSTGLLTFSTFSLSMTTVEYECPARDQTQKNEPNHSNKLLHE